MTRLLTRFRQGIWMLVPLSIVGCAVDSPPIPLLYPAKGSLQQKGQPVASGGLIFLPEAASPSNLIVNANVTADGGFVLETSHNDPATGIKVMPGAPVGSYKAVYHPDTNGAVLGLEYNFPASVIVSDSGVNEFKLTLPDVMPTGDDAVPDEEVPTVTTQRRVELPTRTTRR